MPPIESANTVETADKAAEVSTAASTALLEESLNSDLTVQTTADTSKGIIAANSDFEFVDSARTIHTASGEEALTDQALLDKAEDLREALRPNILQNLFGGGIDFNKVENIVGQMRAEDVQRFLPIYDSLSDTPNLQLDLRTQIQNDAQYTRIIALLTSRSAGTNYSGNIAVALETAGNGDQLDAGKQIRAAFMAMSTDDYARAQLDWDGVFSAQFGGKTLDQAIAASNLSIVDKRLISEFYNENSKDRDAADIERAARLIVEELGKGTVTAEQALAAFQAVVGVDSQKHSDALAVLNADQPFVDEYNRLFAGTEGALDYLTQGRVSLATITSEYANNPLAVLFSGDYKGNIEEDITGATLKDREDFIAGRLLVEANVTDLSAEQERQKQFYERLQESFVTTGGEDQAIIWSDMLEHGSKTILSRLAQERIDGKSNDQSLKLAIEQMSDLDWQLLHSTDGSATQFATELNAVIKRYASSEGAANTMIETLQKMSEADSFADATAQRRSFIDVIAENEGPEGNPFAIADAIAHMSPEDARKYATDPAFREEIDFAMFPTFYPLYQYRYADEKARAAMLYSQSILMEIGNTGEIPTTLNPVAALAQKVMNGELTTDGQKLFALQQIMSDPDVLKKMQEIKANPNTEGDSLYDRTLFGTLETLDTVLNKPSLNALLEGQPLPYGAQYFSEEGMMPGYSRYSVTANETDETERAFQTAHLNSDQSEIQRFVDAQNGVTEEVDYARMYIIGEDSGREGAAGKVDYRDFVEHLMSLDDAGRAKFFEDYERKYTEPFMDSFLARVNESEHLNENYRKVFDNLFAQGFKPGLEDQIRLAVLDEGNQYAAFEDVLFDLSDEQIETLKSDYSRKYGKDLDGDFLNMIGTNYAERITFGNLLRPADTDPVQDFLDRVRNFDDSGADIDGTQEAALRALQINADLIAQYSENREKLSPDVLAAIDSYFNEAVRNNRTTKGNLAAAAEAAINNIVLITALATCWDGVSGVALAAMLGTSVSRRAVIKSIQGDALSQEEEMALSGQTMIDLGATFGIPIFLKSVSSAYRALKAGTAVDDLITAAPRVAPRIEPVANPIDDVAEQGWMGPWGRRPANLDEAALNPVDDIARDTTLVDDTTHIDDMISEGGPIQQIDETIPVVPDEAAIDLAAREAIESGSTAGVITPKQPNVVLHGDDLGAVLDDAAVDLAAREAVESGSTAGVITPKQPNVVLHGDDLGAVLDDAAVDLAAREAVESGSTAAVITPKQTNVVLHGDDLGAVIDDAAVDLAAREAVESGSTAGVITPKQPNVVLHGDDLGAVVDDVAEQGWMGPWGRRPADLDEGLAVVDDVVPTPAEIRPAASLADDVMRVTPELVVPAELLMAAGEEEQTDFTPPVEQAPVPSAELIEMATVRRGEGPWQTAERILAASGGTYGVDEVRALTNALKAIYAADANNPDISGLKVKHNFITGDNFDDLLAAVSNDAVKAALMGLSTPVS